MDGLLVVDKPAGPTSHDVVARVRRALGERRIGHTGTLDPAATGVLALVLGRATRLAQFLSGSEKSYEAVVRLGFSTDTADAQGRALSAAIDAALPGREAIDAALDAFRGTFLQQPPAFSAKKVDGKRSHKLARAYRKNFQQLRAGSEIAPSSLGADSEITPSRLGADPEAAPPRLPQPATVTASAITIVAVEGDLVTLAVDCSAGFYVRSLAHDLGERLGVGGHIVALRRTRSGDFSLADAIDLDAVERRPASAAARVIPLAAMLPRLAPVVLTPDGVRKAIHGRELGPMDCVSGFRVHESESRIPSPESRLYRLVDEAGALVAIARPSNRPAVLHPSVVLV
jgi:tRNA pseudouridine55 synthase